MPVDVGSVSTRRAATIAVSDGVLGPGSRDNGMVPAGAGVADTSRRLVQIRAEGDVRLRVPAERGPKPGQQKPLTRTRTGLNQQARHAALRVSEKPFRRSSRGHAFSASSRVSQIVA